MYKQNKPSWYKNNRYFTHCCGIVRPNGKSCKILPRYFITFN